MDITDIKKTFENAKAKKVSFNMNEMSLKMIDELRKIFGMNRTKTMGAIIFGGVKAQIEFTEKTWKEWIKEGKYDKKLMEKKLSELIQFKKKWKIDTIPS